MNYQYVEGTRWGTLVLKSVIRRPIMYPKYGGGEYHGGEYHPVEWVLECMCGHEWTIKAHEFPGRRKMRGCGRDRCTASEKPPTQPKLRPGRPLLGEDRGVAVQVYIALKLVNVVREAAAVEGTSFSKMLASYIHDGIKHRALKSPELAELMERQERIEEEKMGKEKQTRRRKPWHLAPEPPLPDIFGQRNPHIDDDDPEFDV